VESALSADFFDDFFADFEDFFDDFFFEAFLSLFSMLPLVELSDLSADELCENAGSALNAKTAATRIARVRIMGTPGWM
jgi:hypothetical protein